MLDLQLQKLLPKILTLNVVEIQHPPGIEKTDSKEEISYLKLTKNNGRRKRCLHFKTDPGKLSILPLAEQYLSQR